MYLWEEHVELYYIFDILRMYLKEYMLDTNMLLALIQEKSLPLAQSLKDIPYIHEGFLNVVYQPEETTSTGT